MHCVEFFYMRLYSLLIYQLELKLELLANHPKYH
jgi:hypothetical protein